MESPQPSLVASKLSFKDAGEDAVHPDFPLKDGDVVCLRTTPSDPNKKSTRFYIAVSVLRQSGRFFREMFSMIDEPKGTESVIPLTEGREIVSMLLKVISADGIAVPNLVEVQGKEIAELYAASLKYGIPAVQILVEHIIR